MGIEQLQMRKASLCFRRTRVIWEGLQQGENLFSEAFRVSDRGAEVAVDFGLRFCPKQLQNFRPVRCLSSRQTQIVDLKHCSFRTQHRLVQGILQLPDVSGPVEKPRSEEHTSELQS